MIYITRTSSTIQLEKHLASALPDPNSYNGNEWIVEFEYQTQNKANPSNHDKVFTARFVKESYYTRNLTKKLWKWVYQGITTLRLFR